MNKRIKIICTCVSVMLSLLLSGCAKNISKANEDTSSGITPNILSTSNLGGGDYFYLVDKNTGVVYLCYRYGYRHGMSVMLNPDGTPITAEQIGIEY